MLGSERWERRRRSDMRNNHYRLNDRYAPKRRKIGRGMQKAGFWNSGLCESWRDGKQLFTLISCFCANTMDWWIENYMCCDGIKKICQSLMSNSSLTELNLRGEIAHIYIFFNHNFLPWVGNAIRTEGGKALGELLKMNKSIKSLNLECIPSYLSMDYVCKRSK